MTGFLRQQGQEISKSSLVQQLNIAKGNSTSMSINCENGIYNMDPKQQEIKQVSFVDSRNKPIFQILLFVRLLILICTFYLFLDAASYRRDIDEEYASPKGFRESITRSSTTKLRSYC